jgi:hypothetical protein
VILQLRRINTERGRKTNVKLPSWLFFCVCPQAQAQEQVQKITVTGKLNRTMTIGGESTGWTIYLDPETTIEGKQASSIEVDYHDNAVQWIPGIVASSK